MFMGDLHTCCSVAQSCLTLCDLMDCSMPGFPVLHYLLEDNLLEDCSNSRLLSQWCCPTISSSVTPFSSCLQSFPASGSFPMSWLFASSGQSIGASASASVLPMDIQGWFPFRLTDLIISILHSCEWWPGGSGFQNPSEQRAGFIFPEGTAVMWFVFCFCRDWGSGRGAAGLEVSPSVLHHWPPWVPGRPAEEEIELWCLSTSGHDTALPASLGVTGTPKRAKPLRMPLLGLLLTMQIPELAEISKFQWVS